MPTKQRTGYAIAAARHASEASATTVRPVKPAPGDPQLFDPIGRLALGKSPELRIHRLGKGYGSDHDQRDECETDPGQHRSAACAVQGEYHSAQRAEDADDRYQGIRAIQRSSEVDHVLIDGHPSPQVDPIHRVDEDGAAVKP